MRWLGMFVLLLLIARTADACSFCQGSIKKRLTLREEAAQAKLVLSGTLENPRVNPDNPTGGGMTDLRIEFIVKDDPWLKGQKKITLPRYVFVDAKNPPKFLVFCDLFKDRLDPYRGEPLKGDTTIPYLKQAVALEGKDPITRLRFFAKHLDSDDPLIAMDAFLEFGKSNDRDVGAVAKDLDRAVLRKLLADPNTPEERLGVFAFLLGACGNADDAAFLAKLLDDPAERYRTTFGGILGGYLELEPQAGWKLVESILGDPKRPLRDRLSVLTTVRFFQAWKPQEVRPIVLATYRKVIEQGDIADLVIEDLRRWQWWDLTDPIVAMFARKSHDSQLVRRAIIRYALTAPGDAAKAFIQRTRTQDGELVREIEEYLREFELATPSSGTK